MRAVATNNALLKQNTSNEPGTQLNPCHSCVLCDRRRHQRARGHGEALCTLVRGSAGPRRPAGSGWLAGWLAWLRACMAVAGKRMDDDDWRGHVFTSLCRQLPTRTCTTGRTLAAVALLLL